MTREFRLEVNKKLLDTKSFLSAQRDRIDRREELATRLLSLKDEIDKMQHDFEVHKRASGVLAAVSDATVDKTLSKIKSVLNKAIALVFPTERISVDVHKEMYRSMYPHFVVSIDNNGKRQTFKQNGDGLAQVVSILFSILLVDISGGRKLLVFDECLRGLHPVAKNLVLDIFKSLSDKYQIVLIEHGVDIGTQYEIYGSGFESKSRVCEEPYYFKSMVRERVGGGGKQSKALA